ncbi:GGDEF domain-containing protein [Pseudoalteromonas xiamenensis]
MQRQIFLCLALFLFSVALDCSAAPGMDELPKRLTLEHQVLTSPIVSESMLLNQIENAKLTDTEKVYLYTLVARISFFKGEIGQAKLYFDKAKEHVVDSSSGWSTGYFYTYRAYFDIEQGNLDNAKSLISAAKSIFESLDDAEQLARVAAIEGIILIWREEYSESIKVLEDAHSYILRNNVSATTKLTVVDALTAYYSSLKYYEKGIELAYQADSLAKLSNNILDGLPAKYNLCMILLRKELLHEAQECYSEMKDVSVQFDLPRYKFWAPSGLGKVALANKEYKKALNYFEEAQLYENTAIVNPAHLIVLRNNQAKAYSALQQTNRALDRVDDALKLIESYHSPLNNRYLRQTLRLKANVLENAKFFERAANVYAQYIDLLEETELETKAILEQEAKSFYEAEQHKLQLALADQKLATQEVELKKLQQEKSLTLAYILVFIVTVFSALIFWYFQRQFRLSKVQYFSKDPLTGLFNRLYLHNRLEKLIADHKGFCLVTLDLYEFKKFNDKYGYLVGDEVLRQLAAAMKESFRESQDIIVRSGGEEFVILCVSPSAEGVEARLDTVKQKLLLKTKQMVDDEVKFNTKVIRYTHQGLTTLLVQIDNAFRGHSNRKQKSQNVA